MTEATGTAVSDHPKAHRTYPLGRNQKRVLKLLTERKSWKPGCGWLWGSGYETDKMLRSLARRGLVRTVGEDHGTGYGHYEPAEGA